MSSQKKVYKNKLQRDAEEKKKQRREAMKPKNKQKGPNHSEVEFSKMMNMSEADITSRLDEINKRMEEISAEIHGRMGKQGQTEAIKNLSKENVKLMNEKQRIEKFPEIKEQIIKIRKLRDTFRKRKEEKLRAAEDELQVLEPKPMDEKAKKKRIEEIDKELKEIEEYSKEFAKKDIILDEDKEENKEKSRRYNELLAEKAKIKGQVKENNQDEKTKRIAELKAQIKEYKNGKSKEDEKINKCNLAWKMLMAGKNWDEISIASAEKYERKSEQQKESNKHQEEQEQEQTEQPIIVPEAAPEQPIIPGNKDGNTVVALVPEKKYDGKKQAKFEKACKELREEIEKTNGFTNPYEPHFSENHPKLAKFVYKIPFLGKTLENREKDAKAFEDAVLKYGTEVMKEKQAREQEPEQQPEAEQQEENTQEEPKTKRDAFIDYLQQMASSEQERYEAREKAYQERSKGKQSNGREPGDD